MKVKVLYFAEAKEVMNVSEEYIDFNGSTLLDFKDALLHLHPEMETIINQSMFAVNLQYAALEKKLKDGDTVAIIPPVEGG